MFKSFKTIAYKIVDIENAEKWYGAVLEAKPFLKTNFGVIFRIGEYTLSLNKCQSPEPADAERVDIFWDVDDIDAAYRRLIDLGAKPHMPIKTLFNTKYAKVMDPFGIVIGITATVKGETVENAPSTTATYVAYCRALSAKDEREGIKGPDYLAELFLKDESRKLLQEKESIKKSIYALSPLYGNIVARTRFFDDMFKNALSVNIPQIVFLGAGYDTRAYRFAKLIKKTKIFELDIQSTQKRKRDILSGARIDIPQQVSFVTINFKIDKLHDVLTRAGFDETAETLFIWEGVSYYLTADAINATLEFIKTHSAGGSAICFDYMTDKSESSNPSEPFQFWISPSELKPFLAGHGIEIVEQIDSAGMEKRYLVLPDGATAEKAFDKINFVYART